LGYAGTTGLETMDYRLTDPYLDPPGSDESCYSERSVRLPQSYWCYPEPQMDLCVAPLPASSQAQNAITFGSLNNFSKVNRPTLLLWGRLLNQVPDSRLILHSNEGSHQRKA